MSNPTDKESVAALLKQVTDEGYVRFPEGRAVTSHGHDNERLAFNEGAEYALAQMQNRAISPAQGDGMRDEHARNTLQIIADYPVTDRAGNQDAANMALIASQALRALASHPVPQPGMTGELIAALKEIATDDAGDEAYGYRDPGLALNRVQQIAIAAIKRAAAGDRPASQRQR